ncbi:uncharacterized protein LOC105175505 [Sesamum indicum]|uniref:Uncharacterized protein LOC105175505 n=1 Tax=Sesamum indicum TaxID=4182 RepID=A0A6I9UDM2_SESIN|nr:uncharacterized protein LOC105175505 [Sesamum indicum]
MWDSQWWCSFVPKTLQKQSHHPLLVTQAPNDAVCSNCVSISAIARMLTSWLNRRRMRYLFLILCSPFLLPLFCASCPFICVCYLMCRKRRKADAGRGESRSDHGEVGDEVGLLQRYLEDQLLLVVGSVYECGDGDENDGADVEYFDSPRPLLQ